MFSHVSVHPSIHHSVCPQGGYPSQVQAGGTPARGVPHLRYPSSDLAGGYPTSGTSPIISGWGDPTLGTPSDLAGGTPQGDPTLGNSLPPIRPGRGGGTPPRVTDGVLDTPRSVCLLRSSRRTFLFKLCSSSGPCAFKQPTALHCQMYKSEYLFSILSSEILLINSIEDPCHRV